MTSYLCVWILAVALFLSTGALAARVRGFLAETRHYRNSLFGTFLSSPDERHQQLAVVHRRSRNQIRKTPNSPHSLPPPNFVCQIKFTSTSSGTEKQEGRWGRSALKATLEEACGVGGWVGGGAQTSFLWTEKSVVQMFEGKQGNDLPVGAVPQWKARFVLKIQSIPQRDSDVPISREWTLHFCSSI